MGTGERRWGLGIRMGTRNKDGDKKQMGQEAEMGQRWNRERDGKRGTG